MKEKKVGKLQSLSLQQPTGYQIVVESHRQSLAKKKKSKKTKQNKKQNKDALKMARNKLSILQC